MQSKHNQPKSSLCKKNRNWRRSGRRKMSREPHCCSPMINDVQMSTDSKGKKDGLNKALNQLILERNEGVTTRKSSKPKRFRPTMVI